MIDRPGRKHQTIDLLGRFQQVKFDACHSHRSIHLLSSKGQLFSQAYVSSSWKVLYLGCSCLHPLTSVQFPPRDFCRSFACSCCPAVLITMVSFYERNIVSNANQKHVVIFLSTGEQHNQPECNSSHNPHVSPLGSGFPPSLVAILQNPFLMPPSRRNPPFGQGDSPKFWGWGISRQAWRSMATDSHDSL